MDARDIGVEETMAKRIQRGFEDFFGGGRDFFGILDKLPINIIVFTADGTAVFVNQKYRQSYGNIDPKKLIGVYNFFKDPTLARAYGVEELYRKVFAGYAASVSSTKINVGKTPSRFNNPEVKVNESRVIQISGFPVYDQDKKMQYAVFTSYATNVFNGDTKTVKAQEYIYEHWLEDFSLEAVAKSCGFSKYYLSHFFKEHTGQTPYEYYKCIKIDKLKPMLLHPRMSIAEAFGECGLDYKGQYVRFFKEIVGMTPSEYRRKALEDQ